ncbi:hypothetical protein Ciccas_003029 [Cichlidogyrus casuarinus]|uniref:BTB domain-containing protein n=1 Tax=Cichlidogyrus casuarinus TaxID=1844966 RepID=A0ABD2QFH8_9PLAT
MNDQEQNTVQDANRSTDRQILVQRPARVMVNAANQRVVDHSRSEMGTQVISQEEETKMMDNDLDFTKPFLFSDVTLICNGENLHCHRVILALYSPVFRRMFESDFKEKETNVVNLPDEYDDMLELLMQMYGPNFKDLDSNLAKRILPLAHKYLITNLQESAERTISFSMTDSTAPECLLLAERFGLKQMRKTALDACAKWDLGKLNQLLDEYNLSSDLRSEIFQRRIEILEKCIGDIQRSFTHSCVRMESKLERVPANHCSEHNRPLTLVEIPRTSEAQPPAQAQPEQNRTDAPRNEEETAMRYNVSASIRPAAGMIGTVEERNPNETGPQHAVVPAAPAEQVQPQAICEKCVDNFKDHISELCKRAMHKVPIVLYKPNR